MRAFARKPEQGHKTRSAKPGRTDPAFVEPGSERQFVLRLQRTVGNRAARQWLQAASATTAAGRLPAPAPTQVADRDRPRPPLPGARTGQERIQRRQSPGAAAAAPANEPPAYSASQVADWALPIRYRLSFDPGTRVYRGVATVEVYSAEEMAAYGREAEAGAAFYERQVAALVQRKRNLQTPALANKRGAELLRSAQFEAAQACFRSEAGGATRLDVFRPVSDEVCKIQIEQPRNPFLAYPYWQHERSHQRDCLAEIERHRRQIERKVEFERGWAQTYGRPYTAPSSERVEMKARRLASATFSHARFILQTEIDAYRLTVAEIRRELATYGNNSFEPSSGGPMSIPPAPP